MEVNLVPLHVRTRKTCAMRIFLNARRMRSSKFTYLRQKKQYLQTDSNKHSAQTAVRKMTNFDLWPPPWGGGAWGAGTNMWHPETPDSNEFLPAPLATQIPTLWIHKSGGRGRAGALILNRCWASSVTIPILVNKRRAPLYCRLLDRYLKTTWKVFPPPQIFAWWVAFLRRLFIRLLCAQRIVASGLRVCP